MRTRVCLLIALLCSVTALCLYRAEAQANAQPKRPAVKILQRVRGYEHWPRFARYDLPPIQSQGHSDQFVVGYYNDVATHAALGRDLTYLEGSVLVLEDRQVIETPPRTLSVMARLNERWFWLESTPDGRVLIERGQPIAGHVRSCITCHVLAGTDMVYSNGT
jgi:hypothetical protein